MSELFSVVMTGKIADGRNRDEVKASVAKLFKLNSAQLEKMFSGKPVAVRRDIDRLQADKICAALLQAGAEAKVKARVATATKPQAAPAPKAAASKPAAVAKPAAAPKPGAAAKAKPAAKPAAPARAADQGTIECPRCGHEQPFTTQCGLCKMDLTLHIQRLEKREKARQVRRQAKQASR